MAMSSVSVVTNSLRLRGFRQPRDAEEILHPPFRARVGEYAYLVGIAILALAIGVAALYFAQPEHQMSTAQASATVMETDSHTPAAGGAVTDPAIGQHGSVQMTDYAFESRQIVVKANQPVELTVHNEGKAAHDWSPQGLGQAIHVHAGPGEQATGRFTPTAVGTFKVICSEPDHEQLGMVGELVVQP
jgi:uncharacterized cupredoxin-like copper-binding protein